MSLQATITSHHGMLHVAGAIDFLTVEALWAQSIPLMAPMKEIIFDCSQVNSANSAALALLVEWLKYANKEQKSISFRCLPSTLMSLAKMAGVGHLLDEKEAVPA